MVSNWHLETKVPGSSPGASYAQRWAPCSNRPANVQVPVKWGEVVERSQIVTPSLPLPFPAAL